MEFMDCNVRYGVPAQRTPLMPVPTVEALRSEMERAGVSGAVVKREEVYWAGVNIGNRMVAQDIAPYGELYGLWAVLPTYTHEVPEPEDMLEEMRKNRIVGWLCWPELHRYTFREFTLRAWFDLAKEHQVPFFLGQGRSPLLHRGYPLGGHIG